MGGDYKILQNIKYNTKKLKCSKRQQTNFALKTNFGSKCILLDIDIKWWEQNEKIETK